jgi:hypothetical protein
MPYFKVLVCYEVNVATSEMTGVGIFVNMMGKI